MRRTHPCPLYRAPAGTNRQFGPCSPWAQVVALARTGLCCRDVHRCSATTWASWWRGRWRSGSSPEPSGWPGSGRDCAHEVPGHRPRQPGPVLPRPILPLQRVRAPTGYERTLRSDADVGIRYVTRKNPNLQGITGVVNAAVTRQSTQLRTARFAQAQAAGTFAEADRKSVV